MQRNFSVVSIFKASRKVSERFECRRSVSALPLSYTGPDEAYYEKLTASLPVEVKFTPNKGRTLFARRKISEGEILFSDAPIVAAPAGEHASNTCNMCLRPLVPTQLFLADDASRKASLASPVEYQEFKSSLLRKIRVQRLETREDAEGRKFCSSTCQEKFSETYSAAPHLVRPVSNDARVVGIVGVKDRSVMDLIVRLLIITQGWRLPLPAHAARCAHPPNRSLLILMLYF